MIGELTVTLATLFLVALIAVYITALPLMGVVAGVVHAPLLWLAEFIAEGDPNIALTTALLFFVGGWILQLIGHVFEGRRPALFDNLLQVLVAPAFLVSEALFAAGFLSTLKEELRLRSCKYDNLSNSME